MHIDLNCDMGEGIGNDEAIMPFITSANIACGYHAGNEEIMKSTILLAKKHSVNVGAHPAFFDKENFGRTKMQLPLEDVYQLMIDQLHLFQSVADHCGVRVHHVKPHGALYNMAARDKMLATTIANAVKDFDSQLIVYGLSNSFLISEAQAFGLKTKSEAFADRTYQDDGSLTSRLEPGALIEKEEEAVKQVLHMVQEKTVTTVSGKKLPIVAETICIHSDGKSAVQFAKLLSEALHKFSL